MRFPVVSISVALLICSVALAGDVTIVLPAPEVALRGGKGLELAQANCLICHSSDYMGTQPPMPRKFWEGEVKKMREKYGAPTPVETVPRLVDYLAATYGTPEPSGSSSPRPK